MPIFWKDLSKIFPMTSPHSLIQYACTEYMKSSTTVAEHNSVLHPVSSFCRVAENFPCRPGENKMANHLFQPNTWSEPTPTRGREGDDHAELRRISQHPPTIAPTLHCTIFHLPSIYYMAASTMQRRFRGGMGLLAILIMMALNVVLMESTNYNIVVREKQPLSGLV